LGSLNLPTSLGAGPLICTDDRNINPGFSPAFAFFTFGIPHRVGMNQYGALGRAKAGQSVEDILRAYYQNFEFSSGHEGENIVVNGTNEFGQTFNNESMSLDEYLKHLYEMPTSWPSSALQAQAIAARSYGLAIQKSKGYVRPSQADQVVKKELNSGSWIAAVEATKGKIMSSGGQPIKGWFASTSGGYTFTSADVWGGSTNYTKRMRDTTGDVSSFADLISKSYDKDSPCLYAAQGYRKEYSKSAWLKSDELADIVNVLLLARNDSSTQEHLYQPDKSNPAGTDTWNVDRVKQELRSRSITPFNSISSVSISADFGSGMTTNVSINGDGGSPSFGGNEFKNFFNLRAPANISIVGPLFNVEKK
jgi:SpoIID/LytB domain protein